MKRFFVLMSLVFFSVTLFSACSGSTEETDGGEDGQDAGPGTCVRDNSERRPATLPEWQLVADAEALSEFICPQDDFDYFWFELTTAGTIVELNLINNAPMSPVDLCYAIYFIDGNGVESLVGTACDHDGMDGVTDLQGRHYAAEAGTYFVEVYDESRDDEDPNHAYKIMFSEAIDPDPYEPNNDMQHATPLSEGQSLHAYISFLGDPDWYTITAGNGDDLISLELTTASAQAVDLRYSVYAADGTTLLNTGYQFNGMSGATNLTDVIALTGAGVYYVVIDDEGADDGEIEVGYNLVVDLLPDNDPNDAGGNSNDGPEEATTLSDGQLVTAYLSSREDEDWYVIEAPGTTAGNPAVIEVELIATNTDLWPVVNLIVADPSHTCQPGVDECLLLDWTCSGTDVEAANSQCPSHECITHEGRCSGAGSCLPRTAGGGTHGCGIRSLVVQGCDWSPLPNNPGDPSDDYICRRHLHTTAPMFGSYYFIKVHDFAGGSDPTASYTLRVSVHPELDSNEPNGLYLPYITEAQEEISRSWNHGMAIDAACSDNGSTVTCNVSGLISYRGDQDWYVLDIPQESKPVPSEPTQPACDAENPCANGGACTDGSCPCMGDGDCNSPHWICEAGACVSQDVADTAVDWNLVYEYNFGGNPAMVLYYETFLGGRLRSSICATPGSSAPNSSCHISSSSGTFQTVQDSQNCLYLCGEYHGGRPMYLRITQDNRRLWDYTAGGEYNLTVTATRGCPQSCHWCQPTTVDHACPNSTNPNPGEEE